MRGHDFRILLECGSYVLVASLGVAEEYGAGACSWVGIPRRQNRATVGAMQKPHSFQYPSASSLSLLLDHHDGVSLDFGPSQMSPLLSLSCTSHCLVG